MNDRDRLSLSRRIALGAAAFAIALGIVGFLVWWHMPMRAVSAPRLVESSRPAATVHAAPMTPAPPTVAQHAAMGAGTAVQGGTEIDVCGVGKIALEANDPNAAYRYLNRATHKTADRWMASLLNSDDIRARAAGLLMQGRIDQDNLGTHSLEEEQARDELVALAVGAGDPAVYALALSACGAHSGTCQQLSASTWARLDPDNVWPWLMMASQAHLRKDSAAESDAFAHAASAHTVDQYTDSLFTYAEPAMPSDASGLDRWFLTFQLFGIQSAMPVPANSALRPCSGASLQESGVTAQCNAVAEVLVGGATTLRDFAIGTSLGERLGWPKQRLSELRDRRDAMLQTFIEGDEDVQKNGMWTCGAVEKGNAFMHRRSQVGELEAARERMERSGESVPELARQEREYVDKIGLEAVRDARSSAADSEESMPFQ